MIDGQRAALVLHEGTEEDIQRYIRRDEFVDLFDELVLPPHLRDAWSSWLAEHPQRTHAGRPAGPAVIRDLSKRGTKLPYALLRRRDEL